MTFPNSIAALMGAIESMSAFLTQQGAGSQALYHAQLAAEELGVNIIKYAYRDQQEHQIKLTVECLPDGFRLQILDDGIPFDIRQATPADPEQGLDEREPGGWGIGLVRRVARRIEYERRDHRNILTLEIPSA